MNPHGDFSAGGSSSGSGAGTAAYQTMVSVGSETAGSLIVPASWNGVVGMYPSKGVVDGSQVIPLIKNNDSAGPIGRNVKDVAALLGVIDTKDVDYVAGLTPDALKGVKAGFLKADVLAQPKSDLEDTTDNATVAQIIEAALTAAGASVTDVKLPSSEVLGQASQPAERLDHRRRAPRYGAVFDRGWRSGQNARRTGRVQPARPAGAHSKGPIRG